MKKIILLLNITLTTSLGFAQCDPTTINDIPTVYTKEYSASYKPTPEQEKYMATIFTSVIEPALKSTKGLKGSWQPMGEFKATPEGLTPSDIEMYMPVMGCSKDKKIYTKHESGLVINFTLNDFAVLLKSEIATVCIQDQDTYIKAKDTYQKKIIYFKTDGNQIYRLQAQTVSEKYNSYAFYRQTDDGKYFVITKPGAPIFIPVTIKQALEVNKKNTEMYIANFQEHLKSPGLLPETRAAYEKKNPKDIEALKSLPDPEKQINEIYKFSEETKKGAALNDQKMIEFLTTSLTIINNYLKITSGKDLEKPAYNGALISIPFQTKEELKDYLSDYYSKNGLCVILNPAYFNRTASKTAPQFICIELRGQTNDAVTVKAFTSFEEALDFKKLQSLLVK